MLTTKFLRAHNMTSNSYVFGWMMKLIFEFWGFCVNGGSELNTPHGFAGGTGYATMPPSFPSAGLLASGSDGITNVGMPFFNTVNPSAFSASYVNKYLVMWQSGSTCTDDSIYQITQWFNSSSIRLNVFQGGTPYSGTLHPSLTSRTNVNWRVVDFAASATAIYNNTSSLVLAFNDAGNVNPGQANSQVKLRMDLSNNIIGISLSPSGSWQNISGTWQFTDPTTEREDNSNTGHWGSITGGGSGYFSMWAAGDFFIFHYAGTTSYNSDGFHVEIPQRLYPAGDDPNPIVMMMWGEDTPHMGDSTKMYGGGFYAHNPPDGSTMQYYPMGRRFLGDDLLSPAAGSNGRQNGIWFNTYRNQFLFTDAVLAQPQIPAQYQLSRMRLRRVRFIPNIIPQFQRIGNNGEWLHVVNGIMWPWDNTLLPYNLFLGGT
jgi:hypothetical protein